MPELVRQQHKTVAWASLTINPYNHGNYIIDYAVNQLLGEINPMITFSAMSNSVPTEVHQADIVFCPGATCLSVSEARALVHVSQPIIPFAACFWERKHHNTPSSSVRRKFAEIIPSIGRLEGRRIGRPQMTIVDKSIEPIGCRDSWTYNVLRKNGYKAEYVGCPVLFLNDHGQTRPDGYVAVSLPRLNAKEFLNRVTQVFRGGYVKVLVLENHERELMTRYPSLTFVEAEKSGKLLLEFYKESSCVITGRLHGCLPAIAYGKHVLYVSDEPFDTRNSLLRDIGVTIHSTSSWELSDLQFIKRAQYDFLELGMKKYVRVVGDMLVR